jgi:hypothetical protein
MRLPRVSRIAAAMVLVASAPALAQSDNSDRAAPPRAGNIYDHKAPQPTASDVRPAASPAGNRQQVEKEVQELLRQTDKLDKQSQPQKQPAPGAPPSGLEGR